MTAALNVQHPVTVTLLDNIVDWRSRPEGNNQRKKFQVIWILDIWHSFAEEHVSAGGAGGIVGRCTRTLGQELSNHVTLTMASNRSHPITVPQQLRWWSTSSSSLWERTTSTEGIIITVDSFRKHSPPSWPSLILSLTAVTFAISPQLVVGMSVPATGATQTPPAATAARINSIESPSNFTNSVVDDDDGRLVDGGSQQARNANESQQSSDDVVIPTSLNVNLSAIPLIAGVTSAPGGGGGGGLQLPPGEVPRDANDDNRTSSSALMASASTNETSSVSPPTRPPISLLQGFLASIFCMLIVLTVIGNTLVILSVLTTRRLRTVTNCFVMSLAVADWLVGLFVMPPAVAVFLLGEWKQAGMVIDFIT